jgi:hypothetical protein
VALAASAALAAGSASAGTTADGEGAHTAVVAQAPGDEVPPDDGSDGDEEGDEGLWEEPDSSFVPADSAGVQRTIVPEKTVAPDSLRSGGAAGLIREPGPAGADSLGRVLPGLSATPGTGTAQPGAAGTGTPAVKPPEPAERRGVLGLHPAFLIVGLVAAHVFLVKLVTD